MRLVTISDTHCKLNKINIPEGDVLLHAGDLTFVGDVIEINSELNELQKLTKRFEKVIFVPGNHDWMAATNPFLLKEMCDNRGITLLNHESCVIGSNNIKVFGSGYTPYFGGWALNVFRGSEIARYWSEIPDDTDILITHGPAYNVLDACPDGKRVGCEDLESRIKDLKKLKLHVFGHIHHSYGQTFVNGVHYVNASVCTERYLPTNNPIVIDFPT